MNRRPNRPAPRRVRRRNNGPPNFDGAFVPGPMDPPSAFKAGWKSIRLSLALGSTSVTITEKTLVDGLLAVGLESNSYRLNKISVWVMPGTAANQSKPEVQLNVFDPVKQGSCGIREDTGLLSRSAHLHYRYSSAVRQISLPFPTGGAAGQTLAKITASQGVGDIQISFDYYTSKFAIP